MIGMSQIKKKLFTGIAIGGAIGAVGIGLTMWWAITTIKSYEKGTNAKYNQLYMEDVAVLNRDVIQGEVITEDMITTTKVHKTTVPSGAMSSAQIVNMVANFNIPANIPITQAMVAQEILSGDVREQELNSVVMPSDLVVGDYVDVRIAYPNGTDFVVLAGKQIEKITEQTMWIDIGEDERLLLSSAIVDSYLKEGSKLYATKYIDAATQKSESSTSGTDLAKEYLATEFSTEITSLQTTTDKTDLSDKILDFIIKYKNFASVASKTIVNYQPNEQVIQMMKSNKNILDTAKQKLSSEARQNIEGALNTYQSQNKDDYNNVITGAQTAIATQKNERTDLLSAK